MHALDPNELAKEFGVSDSVMSAFIARFSPSHVLPNAYHSDADTVLFVHIPKTAGVSIGRSLREAFDQFHGVQWDDVVRTFRQSSRRALYEQSKGGIRQVIMGHYGWPELQIWRNQDLPMKCGAIFRDPVARAISNYNYNCSDAHPGHEDFQTRFPTLEGYVRNMGNDVQISQAIGMIDSFETALCKLASYYTFLGVTEHLSASLTHFRRSHGLPNLHEYRENIGKIRAAKEIPDSIRLIVERNSHNDIKLHRLLLRIYEPKTQES